LHQPLHRRLRSVSAGPPPRERLRRVLWGGLRRRREQEARLD
jgi:hypothetical protein